MTSTDLLILAGLLAGYFLFRALRSGWGVRPARRKELKGRLAKAAAYLESEGYRLLDVGAPVEVETRVDGRSHRHELQADLLVGRGTARYVVQVLGRSDSSRVGSVKTRRQLLEYVLAYRPAGILLFDPDKERLRTVEVRIGRPFLGLGPGWAYGLTGALLGAAGVYLWLTRGPGL